MISKNDLAECLEVSQNKLLDLRDSNVLILGASGFVGGWLSNVLALSNLELGTNIRIVLASRNPKNTLNPEYVDKNISFLPIDLLNHKGLRVETFDFGFHLATPSVPKTGGLDAEAVYTTTINATQLLIENAIMNGSRPAILHASSGGVYKQDQKRQLIAEDNRNVAAISLEHNYKNAKIQAEKLILESTNRGEIKGTSPRLFAFFGPGVSLDDHFAIGNFMGDKQARRNIEVKGNPKTTRSYLYPTDMVNWILAAILNPSSEATHIGSEETISMKDLAEIVSDGKVEVNYPNPDSPESHYVPSTANTRNRLGVNQRVSLEDGLVRWQESLKFIY
jgi:nucleoside-diphosphate-sugar epimerase